MGYADTKGKRGKDSFACVGCQSVGCEKTCWSATGGLEDRAVIPHSDGAGVIDAVGPGISRVRIGERVWVYQAQYRRRFGTAAQFVTLPAQRAVTLPTKISFEVGACLGIPAITAHPARWLLQSLDPQSDAHLVNSACPSGD